MLGGEHGEQGSDDARAVDHGSFADVISLQGQQALSERCSDSSPTDPCSRAA